MILDAFLVLVGIGAAIYFWNDNHHWATGLLILAFGMLVVMVSLSASFLTSLAFSDSGWHPLARSKTYAAIAIGITISATGMLLTLIHVARMLWRRMQQTDAN